MSLLHRFLATGAPAPQTYSDDVFSAYTYTGNNSTQTITNGIAIGSTSTWSVGKLRQTGASSGYGIATDTSNNVYTVGKVFDGSNEYISISKYNTSGVIQWQRKLQQGGSRGYGIAIDSSSNVYVTGSCYDGSNDYISISKYNTSGVIQWQRKLQQSPSIGYGITVDASGNAYITGYVSNGTTVSISKYNTSGVFQWERNLSDSGTVQSGKGIAIDSSGNVYVTGFLYNGSINYIFISKYNISGVIQWQRKILDSGGLSGYGFGISTDSSGNVYVSGQIGGGGSYVFICKYNTSGAIQWQRTLKNNGGDIGYGIVADSSGNCYVTGIIVEGTVKNIIICKYNTSGVLQWQRQIKQETNNAGYGLTIDGSGNLYVVGSIDDGSQIFAFIKLLQDGSANFGTANSVVMSVGTATDAAGTATDSAGTATSSAGGATDSAGTATDSAGTATYTYGTQAAITGKGGLVWIKGRSGATDHALYDTARGATFDLVSNTTAAQTTQTTGLTSFNANGFSTGALAKLNTNNATYVGWTFAKAPKFFDIVTYTGNGANRTISHNLGSVPGMIIIKSTTDALNWAVYHTSLGNTSAMYLNSTSAAFASDPIYWNNTSPTASQFSVGTWLAANTNGASYVAYIFAHDTSATGLIQCGSFTTDGSGNATVNLGWEPQYLMMKSSTSVTDWATVDSMRGFTVTSSNYLYPNQSLAELSGNFWELTATGFKIKGLWSSQTAIYLAIRRPNKPPTLGTQVYNAIARTGTNVATTISGVGFAPDYVQSRVRDGSPGGGGSFATFSRLIGPGTYLNTGLTSSAVPDAGGVTAFINDGVTVGGSSSINNGGLPNQYINHFFKRAPGTMDEICFTGTGANTTQAHNLAAAPELWLVKSRSGATQWVWGSTLLAATEKIVMPTVNGRVTDTTVWNSTYPTSTVLSLGTSTDVNNSAATYVGYLWATAAGISKVGTYTGNGGSQTINCGFTTGARFVMIIRATASTSQDIYLWDSTRGIVAGNDPRLSLNTTAAEVTTLDTVDADTSGFIVNTDASNVNVNGAVYLYLSYA